MGNKLARRRSQIDDRYTRPQGLYQHKDVDHRKLRRLIIDSKLAPCYPGAEDSAIDLDECPICFLHYPSLNRSKCCTKGICTECFLQVKSPHSARPTQCPFCKTPSYAVEYRGAKTQEEKGVEQAEEQKVIEAKIRIRQQQEIQDEEARQQRREEVPPETLQNPAPEENDENSVATTPVFPVFAASTTVDTERMSAAERSWNNWTTVERPAIGYPQSEFFTFPPMTSDPESTWLRGNQRDTAAGSAGPRANLLSSSSTRDSFNLRRRIPWSNLTGGNTGGDSGFIPHNRDDDFDMDLEDIMLMEAIWLSIQEQSSSQRTESPLPLEESSDVAPSEATAAVDSLGRRSVTGGFASAIAALAERQAADAGGSGNEIQNSERVNREGEEEVEDDDDDDDDDDEEVVNTTLEELMEKAEKCKQASEESEVSSNGNATSSSSGTWMMLREGSTESTSDVLDRSSDGGAGGGGGGGEGSGGGDGGGGGVVPESFEEQMMLAMALSLADAQAKKNVMQEQEHEQQEQQQQQQQSCV